MNRASLVIALATAATLTACGGSGGDCCVSGGFGAVGGTGGRTGTSTSTTSGATSSFGSVAFSWTLRTPDGRLVDCGDAGVIDVQIQIEQNQILFPCHGASGQGGTVDGVLASNAVPFSALALGGDGGIVIGSAAADLTIPVNIGQTTSEPVAIELSTQYGSLNLGWTFGDLDCIRAGVDEVQVSVAGLALGTFPCNAFGTAAEGVLLDSVPSGETDVELLGLGWGGPDGGTVIAWSGDAGVNLLTQGTSAEISLQPLQSDGGSTAFLSWAFEGAHCGDAGEPTVAFGFGPFGRGLTTLTLPCMNSPGLEGVALSNLQAGAYSFSLAAALPQPADGVQDGGLDGGQLELGASGTFFVNGLSEVEILADLGASSALDAGTLSIATSFNTTSCLQAGIDSFEAQLLDPTTGTAVGMLNDAGACDPEPLAFGPLAPGLYVLNAVATAQDLTEYAVYGLSVAVVAGSDSSYVISLPVVIQ